ncbi:MAG: hypothetical protein H6649_11385 [Caldilineae bacterium]|nr:hypothetical protein [Anaerolineae bacterium]MCB9154636.1 hypothetical protein [Caldilineae bacterium]
MKPEETPDRSGSRYVIWMIAFAALFLISAGAVLMMWGTTTRVVSDGLVNDPRVVLGVTLMTATISLVGFISTTWLAWRKESRESASYRLQMERQQLEIERLRLELEKERGKKASS